MEEAINEIMEFVERKVAGFSNMDQALMFEELVSRMSDLNADALKAEYLGTDEYIIDGV